MESGALALRTSPYKSVLLWVPVLGVGVAAVLAGPPPGNLEALAKSAALRVFAGDFQVSVRELAAGLAVGAWLVAKPLAVIGAFLLLEFRFSPGTERMQFMRAWIAQFLTISFVMAFNVLLFLLVPFPEPLLQVEAAGSLASFFFVLLPAFFLSLLIGSFLQYWTHRAFHHFPPLWRFHSLHHSFEINVLDNFFHPVEWAAIVLFVAVPNALLIGVSTEQLLLIAAYVSIQSQVTHTRLPIHLGPLRAVLSDNRYHYIHHSLDPAHHDKNFSDMPVWDRVFGTYVPAGHGLMRTGLPDRAPPETLGQHFRVQLAPRERC